MTLNEEKKEISFESVVYTGIFLCCDESGLVTVKTNDEVDDDADQRWFSFKTKVCRSNLTLSSYTITCVLIFIYFNKYSSVLLVISSPLKTLIKTPVKKDIRNQP